MESTRRWESKQLGCFFTPSQLGWLYQGEDGSVGKMGWGGGGCRIENCCGSGDGEPRWWAVSLYTQPVWVTEHSQSSAPKPCKPSQPRSHAHRAHRPPARPTLTLPSMLFQSNGPWIESLKKHSLREKADKQRCQVFHRNSLDRNQKGSLKKPASNQNHQNWIVHV